MNARQLTPSVQQMQAKRRQTSDGRAMTLPEQEMSVQDRRVGRSITGFLELGLTTRDLSVTGLRCDDKISRDSDDTTSDRPDLQPIVHAYQAGLGIFSV